MTFTGKALILNTDLYLGVMERSVGKRTDGVLKPGLRYSATSHKHFT